MPPLLHGIEDASKACKAEEFNTYFSSVFTGDDGSDTSTLQKSLIFCPSVIQTVEFNVCNKLRNLDCQGLWSRFVIFSPT